MRIATFTLPSPEGVIALEPPFGSSRPLKSFAVGVVTPNASDTLPACWCHVFRLHLNEFVFLAYKVSGDAARAEHAIIRALQELSCAGMSTSDSCVMRQQAWVAILKEILQEPGPIPPGAFETQ